MSFFKPRPRTAQQKAQTAKTRLMFRGVAIIFIVFYVIVPMLNSESELAQEVSATVRYLTAAGFSLAVIGLGTVTVLEYFKSKKAGLFDAKAYTDDEGVPVFHNENSTDDGDETSDEDDDEDEFNDEDYDDDEEYDDEEYEEEEYEEDSEYNENIGEGK